MDATRPVSTDLSHYLGMLRRHWWIIVLGVALGAAGAAAVTRAEPKVFRSSASVLVAPSGQDGNVAGGRTKGPINLDTEAQLVQSTAVATQAAQLLRSTTPPDELAGNVTVEVPANTSVLVVTYAADTATGAQAGAHAFAQAYLNNREASAKNDLNAQISVLAAKIRQLNANLTRINNLLAITTSASPQRPNLESQRNTSQNQLNGLSGKLNELTTSTVTAGEIISDARLPDAPDSPNPMLNLASGLMAGLLLGLGLALLRERVDRRIRTVADVRQRGRVPVLAALNERTTPRFDDVLQPYGPGGRVFNRLRNEVMASLRPGDQVIVVTAPSRGSASTLVAANLATALARTGSDVVLIGAHLPDSMVDTAPLARMFGVSATPGLSDLLAGRVGLADAIQQASRVPSLRVITTGGAATAAGLMQSQRLRDTLDTLRRQAGYIVIEAPSTSTGADAQSLASLADAAILAVELRRVRRPYLVDAAEQLRRVGTALLGAVVLPRLSAARMEESGTQADRQPPVALTAPAERRETDDAERTQPIRLPSTPVSKAATGTASPANPVAGQAIGTAPAAPGNGKKGTPDNGAARPGAGSVAPPRRSGPPRGDEDATAVIDLAGLATAGDRADRDPHRPGDNR
jgi:Mrp family chromosome partitioning ATPase/capsular polysaccharide biosynthesis protein